VSLPVKDVADYRAHVTALAARLPVSGKDVSGSSRQATTNRVSAADTNADAHSWNPKEFVKRLWPWAQEAAEQLGLAPVTLLAQAALETGWGKHMMRLADGSPANNLFGIKADRRWEGGKVSSGTLEFEQGVAVRKKESFRAYDSLRDSFRDYVDFLRSNPRYSEALANSGDAKSFFSELQQAGYATDPAYAEKVVAVLESPEMKQALEQFKHAAERPL
jgi:flagellar protein FlgJ